MAPKLKRKDELFETDNFFSVLGVEEQMLEIPRRQLHGIRDDFNRKGLLSETGERKDVWEVLKHT